MKSLPPFRPGLSPNLYSLEDIVTANPRLDQLPARKGADNNSKHIPDNKGTDGQS